MTDAATMTPVPIVPANEASWEDRQAVLGTGYPSRCQCANGIRAGAGSGTRTRFPSGNAPTGCVSRLAVVSPRADTTSGLVAYLDGEPVGSCAIEPRTAYVRLGRVPSAGAEPRTSPTTASGQ